MFGLAIRTQKFLNIILLLKVRSDQIKIVALQIKMINMFRNLLDIEIIRLQKLLGYRNCQVSCRWFFVSHLLVLVARFQLFFVSHFLLAICQNQFCQCQFQFCYILMLILVLLHIDVNFNFSFANDFSYIDVYFSLSLMFLSLMALIS